MVFYHGSSLCTEDTLSEAAEDVQVWWSEEGEEEDFESEGSDKSDDDVISDDVKQEQDDSTEVKLRQH